MMSQTQTNKRRIMAKCSHTFTVDRINSSVLKLRLG